MISRHLKCREGRVLADAQAGQIAYQVRLSLERWEPRIELTDVLVGFSEVDRGTLLIDVRYTIRGSNDPRNLVFPFYVIPPSEEPGGA